MNEDDDIIDDNFFASEEEITSNDMPEIKVLVVDDESEVHAVTRLALTGFEFEGRKLKMFNANSAKAAKKILLAEPDIAVSLLDVVMETEHAGLDLARWIRVEQENRTMRIVLRTGQPGQAPEREVIRDYDINDYKAKTELTSQKMFTLMYTAIRAYDHILLLEKSKMGMENVINATKNIIGKVGLIEFLQATLDQLVLLIGVEDSVVLSLSNHASNDDRLAVNRVLSTGSFTNDCLGSGYLDEIPFVEQIHTARNKKSHIFTDSEAVIYCENQFNDAVFYVRLTEEISGMDQKLIKIFAENVTLALENQMVHQKMHEGQCEIAYRLGEIIEKRSLDTGNHVKRVALYSKCLGELYGLTERECEMISLASPLHDIGKVGTPDDILHKESTLSPDEWKTMKEHSQSGFEMLNGTSFPLMEVGATIAGTHHEKWNGAGYPKGLVGEEIPIEGRITAIADVFDALVSRRCYKDPWPIEKAINLIREESGISFDPKLVELFLDNIPKFIEIKDKYQD